MKIYKKVSLISILSVIMLFTIICNVKAVTIESTTDNLNFRKEPSTDSEVIMAMQTGEESELIEELDDWYKVEYKGLTGYVSKQYSKKVGEETPAPVEQGKTTEQQGEVTTITKSTITKDTKVKILPLIGSSDILELSNGKDVTVITKTGSWVYIQTSEISGWIREDCISSNTQTVNTNNNQNKNENTDTKTTTSEFKEKTAYINEAYVNVREKATTDSEVIKVLALNTEVTLIGEEGDWYKVKSGDDTGYISKPLVSDEKQEVTSRNSEPRTVEVEEKDEQPKTESVATTSATQQTANNDNLSKCEQLVEYAKQYLGCPYVYAAAGPDSFDCSGFTMYVYEHFGVSLPHGATSQSYYGTDVNASKSELLEKLKIGDLVFFLDYPSYDGIGHVGIYIGNGDFIHASSGSGYCVKISTLLDGGYYDRYTAARRIF